jgi:hypothetical protein
MELIYNTTVSITRLNFSPAMMKQSQKPSKKPSTGMSVRQSQAGTVAAQLTPAYTAAFTRESGVDGLSTQCIRGLCSNNSSSKANGDIRRQYQLVIQWTLLTFFNAEDKYGKQKVATQLAIKSCHEKIKTIVDNSRNNAAAVHVWYSAHTHADTHTHMLITQNYTCVVFIYIICLCIGHWRKLQPN